MKINDLLGLITLSESVRQQHIRAGQSLFNTLYDFDSKVADKIRGTEVDPFHIDANIKDFLVYLLENEVD